MLEKSMLENLIDVGYTGRELAVHTGISEQTISKILNGKVSRVKSLTARRISEFFEKNVSSIPIGDLESLDGAYLIETPDGWQRTGEFFNKGELPCYRVVLFNQMELVASEKHLVECVGPNPWISIEDLQVGYRVRTLSGASPIVDIQRVGHRECVDIEVLHPNHRYYIEGISSHNSGKSFVAAQIAANALNQLDYDIIFYFDSEGGAMKEFFKSRGCDPTKIEQILVDSVEDATIKILATFDRVKKIRVDVPEFKCLMILDSLGALVANKFINDAANKKVVMDMGLRARLCLDPLTKVKCADGSYVSLFDLNIGDEVITHLNKVKKVKSKFDVEHDSYVTVKCNGETIRMSKDHQMLVKRDDQLTYISAKDLRLTDCLVRLKS